MMYSLSFTFNLLLLSGSHMLCCQRSSSLFTEAEDIHSD